MCDVGGLRGNVEPVSCRVKHARTSGADGEEVVR